MRNIFSILILLYLNVYIAASINPTQKDNYKYIDSLLLNEANDFNFVFSQKGWRYSTFDSTFVDYNNVIRDTTYFDGEQFIKTKLLQKKIVFTDKEKLKIYRVAKNVKFDLLPDYLELKNIFYLTPEYKQTISINFANNKHSVSWDGLYPDLGNNNYVRKYRKLVGRYKELSDTIYSVLIKKIEILQVYHKESRMRNPMNIKVITLKRIGFPKKYIPKIGKCKWGILAS